MGFLHCQVVQSGTGCAAYESLETEPRKVKNPHKPITILQYRTGYLLATYSSIGDAVEKNKRQLGLAALPTSLAAFETPHFCDFSRGHYGLLPRGPIKPRKPCKAERGNDDLEVWRACITLSRRLSSGNQGRRREPFLSCRG